MIAQFERFASRGRHLEIGQRPRRIEGRAFATLDGLARSGRFTVRVAQRQRAALTALGLIGAVNSFARVVRAVEPSFGRLAWTVPLGIDVVEPAGEIVKRALAAGLLVCSAGEHTVRLLPPLIARRPELQRGLSILQDILA